METPTLHMHTLKISIVDPATVPGGYSFERVGEVLGERLHLLPPFRRRLVEVPGGLHHPLWVEDPDFDLAHHLHRAEIAAPGGPHQLGELISDIASRQLDRSHPLWELWVVEGLEHGHIGFVAKIHHAVADGVAAAAMLANVFEESPERVDVATPEQPWRPERVPTRTALVVQAVAAIGRELLGLPRLLWRTLAGFRAVARRRREAAVSPPLPFAGPTTSFNTALTPNRWFAMTSLSLDDVKAVRRAFDVTLNDVVLGVCAGALRRYLDDRGELPGRALVAGVPASIIDADGARLSGTRVSNMFTSLPTAL